MSIDKLKTVFSTGAFVNNVKHYFSKINEIIDWINTAGSSSTPNYKIYTALISQSGTDAPTARILQNTLGYIPSFAYYTVGSYGIILTNAPYDKIYTPTQYLYKTTSSNDTSITVITEDDNLITINTRVATTDTTSDNKLSDFTIEIRVYN